MMSDQLDIFQQSLGDEEFKVWSIVEKHRGRENAVKADALAWQTGFDGVKVRETVSHLIREHGKLIGSSTSCPSGFFLIENRAELDKQIQSLRRRGIRILYRAAQLSRTSITEIFNQTVLEFENNETIDKKD